MTYKMNRRAREHNCVKPFVLQKCCVMLEDEAVDSDITELSMDPWRHYGTML